MRYRDTRDPVIEKSYSCLKCQRPSGISSRKNGPGRQLHSIPAWRRLPDLTPSCFSYRVSERPSFFTFNSIVCICFIL